MANTSFGNARIYNFPSNTAPFFETMSVEVSGAYYPGSSVYMKDGDTVVAAKFDDFTGGKSFGGILGRKYDQELDTAYTSYDNGIPLFKPYPGVEMPVLLDIGAITYAGAKLVPSNSVAGAWTTGNAAFYTAASGYSYPNMWLADDIAAADTRGKAKFI